MVCVVSLRKDPVTLKAHRPPEVCTGIVARDTPESTERSPSFLMQCVRRGGRPTDPGPQRGGDRRRFPVPLEGRGRPVHLAALRPL